MKKYQYRKYKEVYEVNLETIKKVATKCDDFYDALSKKLADMEKKAKAQITRLKTTENNLYIIFE